MILLNEYQTLASGTAVYPGRLSPHGLMYAALKMNGEAGELAEHIYTAEYRGAFTPKEIELIVKEVGDVAWYCAAVCDELKCSLFYATGSELNVFNMTARMSMEDLGLRLNAEAGKLAEHVGKAMRDDGYGMPDSYARGVLRQENLPRVTHEDVGSGPKFSNNELTPDRRAKIIAQVKAVMLTLDAIADKLGTNFPHCLELNLKKLADRQARGVLQGSGDNR